MVVTACEKAGFQKSDITMQAFSALKTSAFAIDTNELRSLIGKEGKVGKDSLTPDNRTALYYKDGGQFLWVTRQGVTPMADTLVSLLHRIGDIGLSEKSFKVWGFILRTKIL